MITGSISLFIDPDLLSSQVISKILAIVLLIFGVLSIFLFIKGKICPICSHKEMLSIDNPEALKLVKQYDLQVGVNSFPKQEQESDQTKAPTT